MDLTGKHPSTRRSNYYILTYLDHFTKVAQAYPIPNKEAGTNCRVLVEEIFPRFEVPIQLFTDQGREFDNRLMKDLSEVYGIDKICTSAYRPSTNGATERLYTTLNSMLGKFITEAQRDWDTKVQGVMAAYRATVHDATGYSPNFIMFGRKLRAPINLVLGEPEEIQYANPDEFVEAVRLNQKEAHALARDHLGRRAERNKYSYDMRARPPNLRLAIECDIITRGDMWDDC